MVCFVLPSGSFPSLQIKTLPLLYIICRELLPQHLVLFAESIIMCLLQWRIWLADSLQNWKVLIGFPGNNFLSAPSHLILMFLLVTGGDFPLGWGNYLHFYYLIKWMKFSWHMFSMWLPHVCRSWLVWLSVSQQSKVWSQNTRSLV